MKKKNLKGIGLSLNKKSISNLETQKATGGTGGSGAMSCNNWSDWNSCRYYCHTDACDLTKLKLPWE